ncbi:hypothetical protein CL656_02605 [bacterium]|nr:hypothetical protein [bacterium]
MGPCNQENNKLNSRIVAYRVTQSIIRFCFLKKKQYITYSKWFGTTFLKLN